MQWVKMSTKCIILSVPVAKQNVNHNYYLLFIEVYNLYKHAHVLAIMSSHHRATKLSSASLITTFSLPRVPGLGAQQGGGTWSGFLMFTMLCMYECLVVLCSWSSGQSHLPPHNLALYQAGLTMYLSHPISANETWRSRSNNQISNMIMCLLLRCLIIYKL